MRRMSSASRPRGARPCALPASHTVSHTAGASFGWQKISYPSSPVYPVLEITAGTPFGPPIRPTENRNHPSASKGVWDGGTHTTGFRRSRLAGPCTATLWRWSVDSFTNAFRPRRAACSRSQTPSYSLPPTKRKFVSAIRKIVASSIMPPASLHIAV